MDGALRTRNVLIVCVTILLIVVASVGAAVAVSVTGTVSDRDSFRACVASGHPPAECNLAIFGRAR